MRAIEAAHARTCAIRIDGSLWCWGDNARGQLGDSTARDRHVPVRIRLKHVVSIGMAGTHACALLAAGEVWCWGENDDGVLGHGQVDDSPHPVRAWPVEQRTSSALVAARPTEHESLACGFRLRAAGERIVEPMSDFDLALDQIHVVGADTAVVARCTLRDDVEEPDAGALVAAMGGNARRLSHAGADCVDVRDATKRRICYTSKHVVSVSVDAPDDDATAVLDGLVFFDAGAILRPVERASAAGPGGMVVVPAGEYAMGCSNMSLLRKRIGAIGCVEDAMPLHRVYVSAFAIDSGEVTWAEYQQCVDAGGCTPAAVPAYRQPERHPDRAITNVTWDQASEFCGWRGARLPTEAEWEKAARGTDGRTYPWGDDDTGADISPYGVRDATSGVREWIADRYQRSYYARSPVRDPQGPEPEVAARHVTRGSSSSNHHPVEIHFRRAESPEAVEDDLGFRCARSLTADGS